jgi:hypothetical protein
VGYRNWASCNHGKILVGFLSWLFLHFLVPGSFCLLFLLCSLYNEEF